MAIELWKWFASKRTRVVNSSFWSQINICKAYSMQWARFVAFVLKSLWWKFWTDAVVASYTTDKLPLNMPRGNVFSRCLYKMLIGFFYVLFTCALAYGFCQKIDGTNARRGNVECYHRKSIILTSWVLDKNYFYNRNITKPQLMGHGVSCSQHL